jgi:hypothetical protein
MKSRTKRFGAMVLIACIASACGGGGEGYGSGGSAGAAPPPVANPPASTPAAIGFTSYSKQMHAIAENEQPWDVETVSFTFDSDQDPNAYDDLLPPEG